MLLQHPQLLGGTLLLMGMRRDSGIPPLERDEEKKRDDHTQLQGDDSEEEMDTPQHTLREELFSGLKPQQDVDTVSCLDGGEENPKTETSSVGPVPGLQTYSPKNIKKNSPKKKNPKKSPDVKVAMVVDSEISIVYANYLTRPAIKIQSIMRMAKYVMLCMLIGYNNASNLLFEYCAYI